jgi:hypothetical protein
MDVSQSEVWASPISYIPSSDSSLLRLPLTFERHADATDVTDVLQSVKEFDFWEVRTLVTCPSQLHTKSLIYDRQCDAAACLISHALPAPICHRWLGIVLPSAKRLVACMSGNASRPGASPTVPKITLYVHPLSVTLLVMYLLFLFDITPRVLSSRHNSAIRHYISQPMVGQNKTKTSSKRHVASESCFSLVLGVVTSALITTEDRPKTNAVTNTAKGTGTRAAVVRTPRKSTQRSNNTVFTLCATIRY